MKRNNGENKIDTSLGLEKTADARRVADVILRPVDAINSELDKMFLKDDINHFARRAEEYGKIFNPPKVNLDQNSMPVGYDRHVPTVEELNKMQLGEAADKLDSNTKSKLDEMLLGPRKTANLAHAAGAALLAGTAYGYAQDKDRKARERAMQEDAYEIMNKRKDREWKDTKKVMEFGPLS